MWKADTQCSTNQLESQEPPHGDPAVAAAAAAATLAAHNHQWLTDSLADSGRLLLINGRRWSPSPVANEPPVPPNRTIKVMTIVAHKRD